MILNIPVLLQDISVILQDISVILQDTPVILQDIPVLLQDILVVLILPVVPVNLKVYSEIFHPSVSSSDLTNHSLHMVHHPPHQVHLALLIYQLLLSVNSIYRPLPINTNLSRTNLSLV
jgi:hypothetical protein